MLSRDQMYKKYYESNIFNNDPSPNIYATKEDINRPALANKSQDVFNVAKETRIRRQKIDNSNQPQRGSQSAARRRQVYDKLYSSDIFNASQGRMGSAERRGGLDRDAQKNRSSCMEGMENDEEYIKDLKDYEEEHRTAKKEYNVDIYINHETPAERYYRDHYDMHGKVVLPE